MPFLSPGTRISSFTQADLASRSIQYVHTSEEEKHADQFSFTVSDGTNEVNKERGARKEMYRKTNKHLFLLFFVSYLVGIFYIYIL